MLHYRCVDKKTLELLKKLSSKSYLNNFFLVGGTAIALHIGHRKSDDLDFFTLENFESEKLQRNLNKDFLTKNQSVDRNTFHCEILIADNFSVKLDFIKFDYSLIDEVIEIDKIRLLSLKDLIPMKLLALSQRGSKKDFYDIYFLMNFISISGMLDLMKEKFSNINRFHIIKSLTFFDDAELEPNPITFNDIEWETVKVKILFEVKKLQLL